MKKKIISFVCAISMLFTLIPIATFATYDFSLGLVAEVNTHTMADLRAGDTITVKVTVPAQKINMYSFQAKLNFDKTYFTCTSAKYGGIGSAYSDDEENPKAGWGTRVYSNISDANNNGYLAVACATYKDINGGDTNCSFGSDETETVAFYGEFKVNESVTGEVTPFSVTDIEVKKLQSDGTTTTTYSVGSPSPISATVVQELSSVTLTGSVTTPTKGGTDASSVTGDNVDVNVSWSPALTDNKFAADTEYTATVKVTPKTGYVFADAVSVTGLTDYTFSKQSDGSYQASHIYEKTLAKSITDLEITTSPTKTTYTHGDTFDAAGMVVKATYDDESEDTNFTGYSIAYADGATYLKKGATTVTVSAGGKTATVTGLTVNAGALSITGLTATDRAYNGTMAVALTGGTLDGVVTGETVTATMPTSGTMTDANAGSNKPVTVETPALTGTDAGNYTLNAITGVTVNIACADYTYAYGKTTDTVKVGTAYPTGGTASGTGVNSETVSGTLAWYTDESCTTEASVGTFGTVGSQTLYWKFTPDVANTNYNTDPRTGSVVYTVSALPTQELSFNEVGPVNKTYGDDAFSNAATNSSSGGTITYSSSDATVATVNKSTGEVTIVGAGTATITATAAEVPTQYAETTETYMLNVAKKKVDLTWSNCTGLVYDGTAKTVTASVNNKVGSDDVSVTVSNGDQINAGTYTATATALTGTSAANYALPDSAPTQEYTIASRSITPTVEVTGTYTYNGTAQTPTYTVKDGSALLVKDTDYTETLSSNTDAGNATLKITAKENGNYTFTEVSEAFVIAPIELTADNLSWTGGDITKTYDGNTDCSSVTALTISGTGVATVDGKTVSGTAVYNAAGVTEANKVTFTASAIESGNYRITVVTRDVNAKITPATLTVAAGTLSVTKVYDGTTNPGELTGELQLNGVINPDAVTVSGTAGNYSDKNVGTEKTVTINSLTLNGANAGNYTLGETKSVSISTGTITATNEYDVSSTWSANQNVVVGVGNFTEPTFTGIGGENVSGTLTYTCESQTKTADQIKTILSGLSKGATASVGYTFAPDGNYTGDKTGTIQVTMVDIVFTVGDETATASNAVTVKENPTYGDTWDKLITIGNIKATVNGTEIPGTYSLDVTGRPNAGTQTYAVKFRATDSDKYQDVTVLSDSVTVAQKSLKVELKAENRSYDGTCNVTLTHSDPVGVIEGDTVTVTAPTTGTIADADAGSRDVSYTGDITVDNANYCVTSTHPELTVIISKARITEITTENPENKEINADNDKNTSIEALKGLYTELPSTADVKCGSETTTCNVTWNNGTGTYDVKGGTYTYTGTLDVGSNFTNPNKLALTTTVTVKPMTVEKVTLNSTAKTVAKGDVTRATALSELISGVTATVSWSDKTTTTITAPTWDKTLSDVQTIANSVSSGNDKDAVLTLNNAFEKWATVSAVMPTCTLTITDSFPAQVRFTTSVDDITYGGTLNTPVATATAEGLSNPSFTYRYEGIGDTSYGPSETAPTDAGTYQVTATLESSTYSGKAVAPFTISPREANISSWNVPEKRIYDGTATTATVTLSGILSGDTANAVLVGGSGVEVGTYTARVTGLEGADAKNYVLTGNLTKEYTIVPAVDKVEVTATGDNSAKVNAALDGQNIVVSGYCKSDANVTVTAKRSEEVVGGPIEATTGAELKVGTLTYTVDATGLLKTVAEVKVEDADVKTERSSNITDSADINVVKQISVDDTTAKALGNAVMSSVADSIDDMDVKEGDTVSVEPTLNITANEVKRENGEVTAIALDVTPKVTVTVTGEGKETKTKTAEVKSTAPVTISVTLPSEMPTENLWAKHEKSANESEYLEVTVKEGMASWVQSSFSPVTLLSDARKATVNFIGDTSSRTKVYNAGNLGESFPTDSKEGYTFKGWKLDDGSTISSTTLTDGLLGQWNGKTLAVTSILEENPDPDPDPDPDPTPVTPSSGGSSDRDGGGSISTGSTYPASVTGSSNGTVKLDKTRASKGSDVTVTLTPDEGYVVDTVTVKDASGNVMELTKESDTVYKFTMPGSKVTVSATFKAEDNVPAPSGNLPFGDVNAENWFYDAVQYAYENGLMNGISSTEFDPGGTTTRAMVVTMLWRKAGSPVVDCATSFTDVPDGQWYTDAVRWAADAGVVKGVSNTEFDPNGYVTREALTTMLYRAQPNPGEVSDTPIPHGDADLISDWAKEAMQWAVKEGVLKGDNSNQLNPRYNATRAEIATIFMNLAK